MRQVEPHLGARVGPQHEPGVVDRWCRPGQLQHAVRIVVADHEPLHAVEPREQGRAVVTADPAEDVADVPDLVVGSDPGIPAGDHGLVVGRDVGKGPHAQDVRVGDVGVGGEEGRHVGPGSGTI